jgi:hypothetical protein
MLSNSDVRRVAAIVLRALLYAGAVTLLVLFLPSEPHVFIYQEF